MDYSDCTPLPISLPLAPSAQAMECRRCGVCCTRHQAFVLPDEMERIATAMDMTAGEWETRYTDPRWKFEGFRLIVHENGACVFLRFEDGLAACAIHAFKPRGCTVWEAGMDKTECRYGLEQHRPETTS